MVFDPDSYNLVARNLTKIYDRTVAVSNLNLSLVPGEFFGFVGPNGAGKTTTILMLAGLLRPTQGQVWVAGFPLAEKPLEVKARIGLLPDQPGLYENLTGFEYLEFAGRMYGLEDAEARRRAEELIEVLDLKEDRDRFISGFSLGMKKKLSLAAAIIHNPRVVFLDEPFNGIDVVVSRTIKDILRSMTERGATVFFSSHVMEVTEKLCTRVGVIHRGTVLACDTPDALRRQAGLGDGATLEDAFIALVGEGERRAPLSWVGRED